MRLVFGERPRAGRGLILQSWPGVGGRGQIAAGITFDVQVGCGFICATVADVLSHVALCCLLDDQYALLAV